MKSYNYYVTFSGGLWDATTQQIVEKAPQFGADEVLVYDDQWLMAQEFYTLNRHMWDPHPFHRGFGWWCWKAFVIWKALERCQEGDVVLYTDADTYPIRDLSVLYQQCRIDGGMMLFECSMWWQREWCKRDCYIVMDADTVENHALKAACGRFILFQKGPWRVQQFLMEWQTYLVNLKANGRDLSTLGPELAGFREHREDQAILTILAHRYGLKLYREADQTGGGYSNDKELYPVLFHQESPWERHAEVTAAVTGSRFRNV